MDNDGCPKCGGANVIWSGHSYSVDWYLCLDCKARWPRRHVLPDWMDASDSKRQRVYDLIDILRDALKEEV